MDYIDLPELQGEDPPDAGLRRLNETDRRALVVVTTDQRRLLRNKQVLRAWADGLGKLSDIPDGLLVETINSTAAVPIDVLLDQTGAQFAFADRDDQTPAGSIRLLTRHETLAAEIRNAPKECICGFGHTAHSPPAVDGERCLDCHRTYRCA